MTFIKIDNTLYPAEISGRMNDHDWDGRSSKTIHLTMSAADAASLFVDDIRWFIVEEYTEEEQPVQIEYDNSEYCMAGDITDHRDGTVFVKMGKATDRELIEIMTGGNQE